MQFYVLVKQIFFKLHFYSVHFPWRGSSKMFPGYLLCNGDGYLIESLFIIFYYFSSARYTTTIFVSKYRKTMLTINTPIKVIFWSISEKELKWSNRSCNLIVRIMEPETCPSLATWALTVSQISLSTSPSSRVFASIFFVLVCYPHALWCFTQLFNQNSHSCRFFDVVICNKSAFYLALTVKW